jgi:hypothetical protein
MSQPFRIAPPRARSALRRHIEVDRAIGLSTMRIMTASLARFGHDADGGRQRRDFAELPSPSGAASAPPATRGQSGAR